MHNHYHLLLETPKGNLSREIKQLYATRPSLEQILQTNHTREIKIYQANQKFNYTLTEIGQYLGLHYTTISKIIKRVEKKDD